MHLPPLRERREDIPLLAEHFLSKYAEQMDKPVRSISHEAHGAARRRTDWPGNVRELENVIERAVALEQSPDGAARSRSRRRSVRRPSDRPSPRRGAP